MCCIVRSRTMLGPLAFFCSWMVTHSAVHQDSFRHRSGIECRKSKSSPAREQSPVFICASILSLSPISNHSKSSNKAKKTQETFAISLTFSASTARSSRHSLSNEPPHPQRLRVFYPGHQQWSQGSRYFDQFSGGAYRQRMRFGCVNCRQTTPNKDKTCWVPTSTFLCKDHHHDLLFFSLL